RFDDASGPRRNRYLLTPRYRQSGRFTASDRSVFIRRWNCHPGRLGGNPAVPIASPRGFDGGRLGKPWRLFHQHSDHISGDEPEPEFLSRDGPINPEKADGTADYTETGQSRLL